MISGMSCGHCVKAVKSVLEELGAENVVVDLDGGKATFDGDIDDEAIKAAIEDEGFEVVG